MTEEVKLLKTWSSIFGLRIVWALKLKAINYDSIDEDLTNKSPLLLQYNPVHKKIPVLVHNGKPIVESLVILEYIDETWQQNPLLPQDPHDRAEARFWAKFGDDKVIPSMWAILTKEGKEQEEASAQTNENLKFLEEELKGKKFFGGEQIGYLDIALGWLANSVPVLEEISLKVIDKEAFPLLSAWMQEFSSVPKVKESLPPHDKLITKFRAFVAAAPRK
ncbi:glutathione s-transferase, putative [Ricinus communis]|uniref:glutathione transferase n=1 Tax=Ricinus communis TaxID=3988 RepID=B9SDC7_RICCO|nr:glutathione s-transferase, putative [Ricinus communis]|eukprot:XP_002523996.1 probable glutathione S-transferase [Ricinus communis]